MTSSPAKRAPDLTGLRVCITRPQQQQSAWRTALAGAGAETLSIPLLAIEPLRDRQSIDRIKALVMDLDHYQVGIFVSRNAVHHALEWIDRYWPQPPLGIDYFAVGEATARALREDGIVAQSAQQAMNSEALLALPVLQAVADKKVVIFRGRGGRPLLAEQLCARGAQVQYCELYQRRLPAEAAATMARSGLGRRADVISVHSGETLTNLEQVIETNGQVVLRHLPLLVPGQRVAELARELGFDTVVVAENATDRAMLGALSEWHASSSSLQ
ncbi:uroporphyrinogen-III synthase [Exilibacterium tricleocarpae]|uniref:Uroporphyrinogen-III synthase n=1 Tax=Exilibacterium tricleocarpae TaxID=2591008 RepID=A0A545T0P5_9GAMM|nr:uroporphyrinogen-III synthase [Exilibacterium tricleocarpae]TQV70776.1 uroporphyrinogen-III synthase [Exilibacterium tricleocarpae]